MNKLGINCLQADGKTLKIYVLKGKITLVLYHQNIVNIYLDSYTLKKLKQFGKVSYITIRMCVEENLIFASLILNVSLDYW